MMCLFYAIHIYATGRRTPRQTNVFLRFINTGPIRPIKTQEVEKDVKITEQRKNLPDEFFCPISNEVMKDPVIAAGNVDKISKRLICNKVLDKGSEAKGRKLIHGHAYPILYTHKLHFLNSLRFWRVNVNCKFTISD